MCVLFVSVFVNQGQDLATIHLELQFLQKSTSHLLIKSDFFYIMLIIIFPLWYICYFKHFVLIVCSENLSVDWDNLGFNLMPADYMYMMKCTEGESFTQGHLDRYGSIELSPAACVLNYGQASDLVVNELSGVKGGSSTQTSGWHQANFQKTVIYIFKFCGGTFIILQNLEW